MLTHQSFDRSTTRCRIGVRRHARPEGRKFEVGFGCEGRSLAFRHGGDGRGNQLSVDRRNPLDQRLSHLTTGPRRVRTNGVQQANRTVEGGPDPRARLVASPKYGQPRQPGLDVRGEGPLRTPGARHGFLDIWTTIPVRRYCRDAERPPPCIEGIQHVGLAEFDANRTSSRFLAVVALEVAVDADLGDIERNSLPRPSDHPIEGGTRDANQVPVVLPAQVGFEVSAVRLDIDHCRRSHTRRRPRSVRSSSTWSIVCDSGATTDASPPVATTTAAPPSSAFIRRTRPSTMSM